MTDDIKELDSSFLGDGRILEHAGRDSEDEEEDEEEESELSEEDEELAEHRSLGGAVHWEAVDMVELDRVMLRVTAAAMPAADNKDMGSRLALQAAALEADNSDLLGLGRIDFRFLTLMRADAAKKAWRTRAMAISRRRPMKRTDSEQAGPDSSGGSRRSTFVTEANIQELAGKAMPSSETFDPEVYLGAIHSSTPISELVRGRQNLKREVTERTSQLKDLVKENFDRFISCKNTIDDIHKRLRKSEAHDSLSACGSSTADMVIAISEVQDEARRAFADLLERSSRSEQIKSVISLLKRYEGLFQLPSRIRQATKRCEYAQVISEYKKARSLMDSMGAPDTKSVWHKLFAEIEEVVKEVVKALEAILRDPETPQLVAIEAIRHILQLQAEKAACAQGIQPINLYVQARDRHLRKEIQDCMERHKAHLQSVRAEEGKSKRGADVPAQEVATVLRSSPASPWQKSREAAAWMQLVQDLVHTLKHSLPDFWHVSQQGKTGSRSKGMRRLQDKLNQLKAVPGASKTVQAAVDEGLRVAQDILQSFVTKLHLALKELISEEHSSNLFLAALREIVSAFVSFRATNTPTFVSDTLQYLLEGASALAITQMTAQLKKLLSRMEELEDFEIIALSHKAGLPASRFPSRFGELLSSSMQQLQSVMDEGCKADSDVHAFNPMGNHAAELRQAFYDCFTQYALSTDQLWGNVSSMADSGARRGLSRDAKLLVLHSNCAYLRTQILKELSGRYHDLLTNDGVMQESQELQSECAEDIHAVEGRLASIYINARIDLINEMLDEYFGADGIDWSQAPLPSGLRDSAYEIVNTLVAVQAEVYGNNLSLHRRVMDELLQHLISAYMTCLGEKLPELNVGGTLQLLLELQYFSKALGPILRAPREKALVQAKRDILKRVDELAGAPSSGAEAELDSWCETIKGGSMGGRAEMVSAFLAGDIIKATRFNVASFKA